MSGASVASFSPPLQSPPCLEHCFANNKLNAWINKTSIYKHFYIFYLKITCNVNIIIIGPI